MSRIDFADFHDHAKASFNAELKGLTIKGLKFQNFSAKVEVDPKLKATATIDADFKKDYYLSTSVKAGSDGSIKPSVTYEGGEHKLTTNYNDVSLKYQYKIPAIGFAITTNLIDGLSSDIHASTLLNEKYLAGFNASYDPSRSGLKKLSYGVLARNPSWWKKGAVSWTIDGPISHSLAVSYQCCSTTVVSLFTEKSLAKGTFGAKYTSPCGAAVTGYGNFEWKGKKVEVGTLVSRNIRGVGVSVGALINPVSLEKKAGLKLTL